MALLCLTTFTLADDKDDCLAECKDDFVDCDKKDVRAKSCRLYHVNANKKRRSLLKALVFA